MNSLRLFTRGISRVFIRVRVTPRLTASLLLLLTVSSLTWGGTDQPRDPHVAQFTPQGTVKRVRQVNARFSEPMMPPGRSRSKS